MAISLLGHKPQYACSFAQVLSDDADTIVRIITKSWFDKEATEARVARVACLIRGGGVKLEDGAVTDSD